MVAPTNIVRFFTVTVGANCVRPPLFTIIAYFRAIRESPLRSGMEFIVGSIHESTVFYYKQSHNKNSVCHSERRAKLAVELSPSEERGESARLLPMRDMA